MVLGGPLVADDNSSTIDVVDNNRCNFLVAVESKCHRSMPKSPSRCLRVVEVLSAANQNLMTPNDDCSSADAFPLLTFDDNKNDEAKAELLMAT